MSPVQYVHVLMTVLLSTVVSAVLAGEQHPAAGSYTIRICRASCTSTEGDPYLTGTVVLFTRPFVDAAGRASGPSDLRGVANGCFSLTQLHAQDDSYAGITRKGFFSWKAGASDSDITFSLYRSPDAGYDVKLKGASDTLVGTGGSWGAGVVEIHAPQDTVIAERTGEANINQCPSLPGFKAG